MRIGIVTTWFERGAAVVSKQYADALRGDHEVFIYARSGEEYGLNDPNWDLPNVTWDPGRGVPVGSYLSIRTFSRWIKANRIELVLWNEQQWFLPVVASRSLGVINVAYVDYYTEETVPLFAIYDHLVCNTKRHMSVFDWHPGAIFAAWGTDVGTYAPTVSTRSHLTFFHSAGMNPYRKGTDLVIRAFGLAASRNEDIRLVLHTQTPLEAALPGISDVLGPLMLSGKVEVIEKTVGAPGLYRTGDVYVYPSRLEGIGLTVAEALASGLPVIVPDAGPMNEFVLNEDVGIKVPIGRAFSRRDGYYWPLVEVEVESLARALLDMSSRGERLKEMKLAARECAEKHFNWSTNARRFAIAISDLAARPIEVDLISRVIEHSNRLHPFLGTSVHAFMALRKANERWASLASWIGRRRFCRPRPR